MAHEIWRVSSFQKVALFTLRVEFDDDTSQIIGFRPVQSWPFTSFARRTLRSNSRRDP
jgi:hypothetical protein